MYLKIYTTTTTTLTHTHEHPAEKKKASGHASYQLEAGANVQES